MSTTTAATLAAALLIPFVLAIPGDSIVVGSDEPSATISTELGADGNASDGAGTQVSVTGPTVDASAADDASPDTEDTEDVDTDPKPKHTELGTVQKVEITTLADGRAVYRLVRSDGATIETLANRVTLKYERNQSGVRHLRFTVFEKDGTERSFTLQNPSPSDESLQQPKANPYLVPRQQLDADAKSQQSQQNTKAALDDLGGINYVKQPDSVKRILTELDKETECEFVDTPLTDALGFIASYHHIPILPDTNALTNVGVSTDEPINLILKDVTLRSVLEIMLKPLGLTYVVEDDVMKVTTVEVADDIVDTRVYDTRQLGDVTSEQLVDVLENAIPDARWKNSDKDKQGGTVSAIDGGLVVMQSQSAHRKIANLLDQLRRKQLAEQQSGEEKTSRSTPQRAPAMMGGMGMGGGFGMSGGAGMRGGGIRMGGGGGGGAFSGVPAGAGPRGAGRTTTTESGVPKTAPEPTAVPQTRLVIYNVDELAKSLIPSPKEGAPETGGGGMGRGGFSGFSKGAAINTITQIIQMGAQASNLPISSQQLPDGNIAVMTTSAGHELVEQTLETLREYAEQPDRRGNGFGGGGMGGGFF